MKRRAVATFLVLFAVWPGVHRILVAAFDVNPWKLAGFAMYARPHFPSRVELFALRAGAEREIREVTAWERALLEDFVERRYTLGELASPRALAEALLERREDLDAVAVRVTTRYLDLDDARIAERIERIEVAR